MKKVLAALCVIIALGAGLWYFREDLSDLAWNIGLPTLFEFSQTEPPTVQAPQDPPVPGDAEVPSEKYFFSLLNERQRQAYEEIRAQIFEFPEKIRTLKIDEDDFTAVHRALIYDNPELFFLTNTAVMEFHTFACWYKPEYSCTPEQYSGMLAALERERQAVFAAVPPGADDYQKEKIVHDLLIASCSYGVSEHDSDIYGALVEHRAICSGYAKAAKYLLDGLGIYNYLVSGDAVSGGSRESHMWNTVSIGGKPYYLDVTWDDADSGSGAAGYTYFNVTQAGVALSHFPEYPPESGCIYREQNYFVREGRWFSAWDDNARAVFENRLVETVRDGGVSFDVAFDTALLRESAVGELIEGQRIFRMLRSAAQRTETDLRTDIVNYSVVEELNVLHIDLTKNYEDAE